MIRLVLCAILALPFATSAVAEEDHGSREGHAHVHGVAVLNAAADGQQLVIELRSPVWNLLGFERAPQNAAEEEALQAVRAALQNGGALFDLTESAACRLSSAEVELGTGDDHDHDHDHVHDSDADDHGYADMVATYSFDCARPAALAQLSTTVFTQFERLETVQASYLSSKVQAAAILKPNAPVLSLK